MRTLLSCFLLIGLSACAFFQPQNIKNEKLEDLLTYVQVEGEGKGRLGINQHNYLFSFDALLKEDNWILAANIPLHGEEVLILRNLKKENIDELERDSLEVRIERGISEYLKSQKHSEELSHIFLKELRKIIRLALYKKLNEKVECSQTECRLGDNVYMVEVDSKQLSIKKLINSDYEILFVALNLTDSIFKRTNIFFHSKNSNSKPIPMLSLELFWN